MTFRHFLDAAYALLVESYLSIAPNRMDLLSAVEKVGMVKAKEETPRVDTSPEAQMAAMLTGVQGGPRVGIPR